MKYLAITLISWLVINLPVAINSYEGWMRFFKLNLDRDSDLGSIWYAANLLGFYGGNINNLTTTAPNQTGSNSIFYIGTYTDIGLEAFQGTIYNCQVYNRVLSNDEISQNYNTIKERFGL